MRILTEQTCIKDHPALIPLLPVSEAVETHIGNLLQTVFRKDHRRIKINQLIMTGFPSIGSSFHGLLW
jgi:hypothetical protein